MNTAARVDAVRRFNRFYTRHVGALNDVLLESEFSITECRILWELGHLGEGAAAPVAESPVAGLTATELGRVLNLDAGYLSRLLRRLKERGLVQSLRSPADARQQLLKLSAAGQAALAPLEARSQAEVGAWLGQLGEGRQAELLQAMQQVQAVLEEAPAGAARGSFLLRPPRPGDMGWVIARHGALYAREYQWDMRFEALVARIAADFVERFDPAREACWIAEREGANIGCVFVVQAREEASHAPVPGVAQLRMLLVEPTARGLGLGERLVAECHRFARDAGYQRMRLWTNSTLATARRIYTKAGYQMLSSEPYEGFGQSLVGEIWEKDLGR